MRPGKPLIFGRIGDTRLLGLPGNPVSALVCTLIFLRPAICRMLGLAEEGAALLPARIDCALSANDERQDYLRATLQKAKNGALGVSPFKRQDSSMISLLADSEALIVRPPFDPPVSEGDIVNIISKNGKKLGRGICAFSSQDLNLIKGYKSHDIERILGYRGREEVIHRDYLTLRD